MSVSEILPYLFLGDYYDAKNEDFFNNQKIGVVINCAKEIKNFFESKGVEYHNLSLVDGDDDIYKHFTKTFEIIKDASLCSSRSPALVHCMAGVSRSAAIVIAFIMKEKKMNYDDASKFVKERRRMSSPNYFFQKQLLKYELQLVEENVIDKSKLSSRAIYMQLDMKSKEEGEDEGEIN